MKFYEITFRLLSPAIISARRTGRGYLLPLSYIPASTLRGAILTHLYWRGVLDEEGLEGEASNPRVIASPAYPMRMDKRSYPCHPFAYKCKVDGETCNYASEALKKLERGENPTLRSTCSRGHLALKQLHPSPVVPRDGGLEGVELPNHWSVSVGMSRDRASSRRGLLFEYEALGVGLEFWATLALPEELAEGVWRGMRFRVGRGISRGFGLAEVTGKREVKLAGEAGRVVNAMRGGRLILYALSPTSRIEGEGSTPLPDVIELSEIAERCELEAEGRLIFKRGFGRAGLYHMGWDIKRGVMRPRIRAAHPGSIYMVEVEGGGGEFEEALAALRFLGTLEEADGHPITGLNLLTPLRGHPMEGV